MSPRPGGVLLDHPVEPGSAEWLTRMSASKIAAAVGLSPYESPFSLWHKMAGTISAEQDKPALARGHYLEPAIVAWFRDQHPEWDVWRHRATYVNAERDWQAASPDGVIFYEQEGIAPDRIDALLECKSASDDSEWGHPGTDEIPVGYRAQVMWQMDTLGVDVTYVAVLTAFLEFREYVVHYDAAEAQALREHGWAFMRSLEDGREPALDGSTQTYQALKELNPAIDARDIEIPAPIAVDYIVTRADLEAAKTAAQLAQNELAAHMGNARRAMYDGRPLATRRAKGDGLPYLVAARNLSLPTAKDAAA